MRVFKRSGEPQVFMDIVDNLIIYFLLALSLGLACSSFLVPLKLTGAGLCRVLSGVILGSLFLVLFFLLKDGYEWGSQTLAFFIFCTCFFTWEVLYLKDDSKKGAYWLFYVLTILCLLGFAILTLAVTSFHIMYFILNALFIGSLSCAMILGQWYLVTPKISEVPLLIAIKVFWLFIGIKLLVAISSSVMNVDLFQSLKWQSDYMFNWIIYSMRFLWGYLALLILSVFAWKLTKIRSIQSSTGVLYVMVFFIFVGEVASIYLYGKLGVLL